MHGRVPSWSYENLKFPSTFRYTKHDQSGNLLMGDYFLTAFPDSEGILFITSNYDMNDPYDRLTIHRIYKNNWFYIGSFQIRRQQTRVLNSHSEFAQGEICAKRRRIRFASLRTANIFFALASLRTFSENFRPRFAFALFLVQ